MQAKNNKTPKKCLDDSTARRGGKNVPEPWRGRLQKVQNSSLEGLSILSRDLIRVIDDQHLERNFHRLELQPKLLPNGGQQVGSRLTGRRRNQRSRSLRCELQPEIKLSGQSSPVQDRQAKFSAQHVDQRGNRLRSGGE